MLDELPRLRALHGTTATIWGGPSARVEDERWVAISGVRHVDFNVVVHHGPSREAIAGTLAEIKAARVPGIVMVTGAALGHVQELVDASWACIGAMPLMGVALDGLGAPEADAGAAVRRLSRDEMPQAQRLVEEAFGYDPEIARTALPDETADAAGRAVWGLWDADGTLVSCAGTMVAGDVMAVWSMATAPAHRRRGHAARLLRGAMAGAREQGARWCLLTSSAAGEPFYRALGFVELERWQQWSRPRWVFSRL